jgi:hypothetical protein
VSLRTKAIGVTAVAVVAGLLLATQGKLPGSTSDADTGKRRGYTLIANTHNNRAVVEAYVVSNVRGSLLSMEEERRNTPWKFSFWAEPHELIFIDLDVWTHSTHRVGESIWSRCEIQFNGGMVHGDTEIDNIYIKDAGDKQKQTHASCTIAAG